jgi:hypothetical protein
MKKLALIPIALLAVMAVFSVAAQGASNKVFTVKLTGRAETPKGSPTGKGTATITLEQSKGKVCFKETWSGIGTPTASHIHKGGKGVAGPILVPLFATPPKHSGCVKASKSLIGQIAKNPRGYYVNIHTKKYPGGALRGQL